MHDTNDPLSEMTGGYTPDDDTPTHFLGREVTELERASMRSRRTAAKTGLPPTAKPMVQVVRERVAPGVVVAYEVPVRRSRLVEGDADSTPYDKPGEKAQTETPYDTPGSSITDQRLIGKNVWNDDEDEDEDDLGGVMSQVEGMPAGSSLEDPMGSGAGGADMPPETASQEHAQDGGQQTKVIPPTGIAGYSSRMLSVAEVEELCPPCAESMRERGLTAVRFSDVRRAMRLVAGQTGAEEREEEKEEQVAPDEDEAFAF